MYQLMTVSKKTTAVRLNRESWQEMFSSLLLCSCLCERVCHLAFVFFCEAPCACVCVCSSLPTHGHSVLYIGWRHLQKWGLNGETETRLFMCILMEPDIRVCFIPRLCLDSHAGIRWKGFSGFSTFQNNPIPHAGGAQCNSMWIQTENNGKGLLLLSSFCCGFQEASIVFVNLLFVFLAFIWLRRQKKRTENEWEER